MSGLLALLDDVAAIAKLASTQLDDIVTHTAKASSKAAGVVIDDAAVTPKYVTGLPAARELPIVWKIARASYLSKLVILLPLALLLDAFLPWLLTPLLMLGGAYLCFEGAEKVWHSLTHTHHDHGDEEPTLDAAHLEKTRVEGAIKTDFILSAEIMTISLSAIDVDNTFTQAVTLALVAVIITTVVYGAVALLVKMDDVGLKISQTGRSAFARQFGRGLVRAMPRVLLIISIVGTAAMLWVGGNIIVHGLHTLGWHPPYDAIHHLAHAASHALGNNGFVSWLVSAALSGVIGLALGLLLIPLVNGILVPAVAKFSGRSAKERVH